MSSEKYLDENLKKYYINDFNNLLKLEKYFWEIDNQTLKNVLCSINMNNSIQTLYSKYSNSQKDKCSYITFCFTKNIELKLFREIIPYFIENYNFSDNSCFYEFNFPKLNPNYEDNSIKFGIMCTDDIDYFNINHITITLESYNRKVHEDFWNDIKNKFVEI
ncbi:hypothetical protein FLJC2902T_25400 [Flavobacterium limnosediminis JC2902]|uniref:Uncharacterized protein n=1 Tax=Flavobacterium limnosediminis JC2902 TaxID=1341181 RepID=V6SIP2_9FLAO|nr:hypothetical protein [Flavobacterium limnosediminis]ESU26568.1 hypothetical protein FLJC2902T_25400 [Flavobacterium limnosediminis JC2902]